MDDAEQRQCALCVGDRAEGEDLYPAVWEDSQLWLCREHLQLVEAQQAKEAEDLAQIKTQIRTGLLPLLMESLERGDWDLPAMEPRPRGKECSVCVRGAESRVELLRRERSGEWLWICREHVEAAEARAEALGVSWEEGLDQISKEFLDQAIGWLGGHGGSDD